MTNHIPSSFRTLLCQLIFLSGCAMAWLTTVGYAQNDNTPKRGFQPGGSYALGDIETISTNSGNLSFHIPLVSLPPGRGGDAALGKIGIFYNSKLWDLRPEVMWTGYTGSPNLPIPQIYTRQRIVQSPEGGWRYGLKYELQLFDRMDEYQNAQQTPQQFLPNCGQTIDKGTARWKLKMSFPDGSVHEFRPQGFAEGYPPTPGYEGWYKIRPDGWETDCIGNAWQNVIGGGKGTANSMTYYSVDGTYLKLVIDHDADDGSSVYSTAWKNNSWALYFPDGSYVVDGGGMQFLHNRNQQSTWVWNFIDYTQPGNPNSTQMKDQLQRRIYLNYSVGATDLIRAKAVGGVDELVYKVRWGGLATVTKNYQTEANPLIGSNTPHLTQQWENGVIPIGGTNGSVWINGVSEIELPTQAGSQKYLFAYNSGGWGEVNAATLPTGAKADYQFFLDNYSLPHYTWVMKDSPKRKDLTYGLEYDGSDPNTVKRTETWTYELDRPVGTTGSSTGQSIVTAPDGGVTTEYLQAFNKYVYQTTNPDGSVVQRIWNQNIPYGTTNYTQQLTNAYIATEFTSITNNSGALSKTAIKDYKYDKNGNLTQVVEYDWIPYAGPYTSIPGNATIKRVTVNDYYVTTPDASNSTTNDPNVYHVRNESNTRTLRSVKSNEIRSNLSGSVVARTEFTYDNALDTANLTLQRSWDSMKGEYTNPLTTNNSISAAYQYDPNGYGIRTQITDANGNVSKFIYGTVGSSTNLYPTQTIVGENQNNDSTIKRTINLQYDFATGVVTQSTDADNNIVTKTTYDPLGRPTLVQEAFGTALERRTTTVYSDIARRVIVRRDKDTTGDAKLVSIQHYDQLGRVRLSRTLENPVLADETDETKGIKVQTRYFAGDYNSLSTANPFRYVLTSNPYRTDYSSNAGSEVAMGWSRSKSDKVGRIVEAQTFGGATLPKPWGTDDNTSTGTVITSYDGDRALVKDQANKKRISEVDGLGRLVTVWEVTAPENGVTEAVSFPSDPAVTHGYKTAYAYDTLDNLVTVNQREGTSGVLQARTFAYSSLRRLTSATQPEWRKLNDNTLPGTTTYQYDNNGNLTWKKDPLNREITYYYDGLNRPLGYISNQPNTLQVAHYYDGAANGKGKLNYSIAFDYYFGGSTQNAKSQNTIVAYDVLGRPLTQYQQIRNAANTDYIYYTSSRTYDLAGNVKSQTYPSGKVVNYAYDNASRLTTFTGNLGDVGTRNYATNITYTSAGQLTQENFGVNATTNNPNGLWHNMHYNNRLQLYDIRLGSGINDGQGQEWTWNRGAIQIYYGSNWAYGNGGVANNGNVTRMDHLVPTNEAVSTFAKSLDYYEYDDLNRIKGIWENKQAHNLGEVSTGLTQQYVYDRFGNRTVKYPESNFFSNPLPPVFTPDKATNRLQSVGGCMVYDAAGNLTNDCGKLRSYDANNRMVSAVEGSVGSSYQYDTNGNRIIKTVGSTKTWMVYGIGGELVAEYPAEGTSSAPQKEYGYRNGQLLVVWDNTESGDKKLQWLVQDHLGSTRMVADLSGSLTGMKRHDYLPFGEEIGAGVGIRAATGHGYPPPDDKVRQKFTGYEKDAETGLDYAQARYFSNVQGRFTSPDSFAGRRINPQTLNLYAYVKNNPLKYIDPTGHQAIPIVPGESGQGNGYTWKIIAVEIIDELTNPYNLLPIAREVNMYNFWGKYKPIRDLREGLHDRGFQDALFMTTLGMGTLALKTEFAAEQAAIRLEAHEIAIESAIEGEIDVALELAIEEIVTLWKAPQAKILNPAEQLQKGFSPVDYPLNGPYFALDKSLSVENFQPYKGYQNGLQEINILKSHFDDLLMRGIIKPDTYYEPGRSVHVPATGLHEFNRIIQLGPPNKYHPQ